MIYCIVKCVITQAEQMTQQLILNANIVYSAQLESIRRWRCIGMTGYAQTEQPGLAS